MRQLHTIGIALALAVPLGAGNGASLASAQTTELRAGGLAIRYWTGQERVARALARAVDEMPNLPGLPADVLADGPISVYLAPDRQTFDSLAPGRPEWSAGVAYPEADRIVLPTYSTPGVAELLSTLRHELAHIALGRYLGAAAPPWFHEGYAQLAAGDWSAGDAWALRFAILLGRLPSLQSLSLDFRRSRVSPRHAYLLSYTAVDYLVRLGGAAGFARLLERWKEAGDLDAALRGTYGLTLGQFEQMWRREVAGNFGWLLVAAQTTVFWSIMTILLLVLGYWKRKRRKRKLEALEAAVREAELAAAQTAESGGEGGVAGRIDGGMPCQ
jgi:hypothetical protein